MSRKQKGQGGLPAYDRGDQRWHRRDRPGMKLRLVVQHDPEAGRWSAVFPELPGCASAGDTEQDAVANAKEALALWFEPRDLELEEGARVLEVAIP